MDIGLHRGVRVRSRVKYYAFGRACAVSSLPGYVRLRDGFPCYWDIVSRHNCYYSELLRNLRELFGDCETGQKIQEMRALCRCCDRNARKLLQTASRPDKNSE